MVTNDDSRAVFAVFDEVLSEFGDFQFKISQSTKNN
jgi:hypothetical protein